MNLRFALKEDTIWAQAGHEIAWEQFKLPYTCPQADQPANQVDYSPIKVGETPDVVSLLGDDFALVFEKSSGQIASFTYQGTELVESGLQLNIWRAATDNDGFKFAADIDWLEHKLLNQWIKHGLDRLEYTCELIELGTG